MPQGSKRSMDPASARTWIPDADSAALTVAATSGSSLIRILGAASNRVTCDPKALKMEASCTPVAPAPTTSIDGGTEESPQASLCVLVSSNPGSGSRRDIPPVQMTNRSDRNTGPLAVATVCASTKPAAPACSCTATPDVRSSSRSSACALTSPVTSRTRSSSRG